MGADRWAEATLACVSCASPLSSTMLALGAIEPADDSSTFIASVRSMPFQSDGIIAARVSARPASMLGSSPLATAAAASRSAESEGGAAMESTVTGSASVLSSLEAATGSASWSRTALSALSADAASGSAMVKAMRTLAASDCSLSARLIAADGEDLLAPTALTGTPAASATFCRIATSTSAVISSMMAWMITDDLRSKVLVALLARICVWMPPSTPASASLTPSSGT
mmetsp:Transcript_65834/g.158780  ORF Transcript_65834/g.158780 Transcript_65834/m.158780 type:complete len:228 (-) Transcript_65834:990-1673(-)